MMAPMWNLLPPGPVPPSTTDPNQVPGQSRGLLALVREYLGGWLGPKLAPETKAGVEIASEKVHSGPAQVVYPWFLPYFDDYTAEPAAARAAYRRMFADPNVKSALLGKILAVGALDLKVRPAQKKDPLDMRVAEFVKWTLTERVKDGFPGLIWSVLSGGLVDGYSVCEKVIEQEEGGEWDGLWPLVAVKPKDVGNDLVLQTDSFRNVIGVMGLRYNAGQEFSPARFLLWRHLPLYDTPTGMSDLRAVYSRYWLLDTVLKLRGVNAEKRAIPFLMGTYANPTQQRSLEDTLARVKSQAWVTVPEGVKVEALNIAGSADSVFEGFIRDLKHDIFMGIQGAILQSLEGSVTDGRGSSQVHRTTADLLVWYIAQTIQSLLNDRTSGLIKDIVDLNFVVQRYPRATLSAVDVGELTAELDIDTKLFGMGVELSKEDMYERYNRVPPLDDADALKKDAGGPPGGMPGMPPGGGDLPPGGDDDSDSEPLDDDDGLFDEQNLFTAPMRMFAEDAQPDEDMIKLALVYLAAELAKGTITEEEYDEAIGNLLNGPEEFAEEDWTQGQSRTGGKKWTNKTTGRVVYGGDNPGKSKRKAKEEKKGPEKEKAPEKKPAGKAKAAAPVGLEQARKLLDGATNLDELAGKLAGLHNSDLQALKKELKVTAGGIKAEQAKALARQALGGATPPPAGKEKPVKPAGKAVKPGPAPTVAGVSAPAKKLFDLAMTMDKDARSGATVSLADLRRKSKGMTKEEFDKAVIELASQDHVDLHRNNWPGMLSKAQKDELVENPHNPGEFFNGMARREQADDHTVKPPGKEKPVKPAGKELEKAAVKPVEKKAGGQEITTGHPAIDDAVAAAKTPAAKVSALFDASSYFADLAVVGHMKDPNSIMQHMVSTALEGQPASVVKEAAKAIGISSPKGDVRSQIARQMHDRLQQAIRARDTIFGGASDQADAVKRLKQHGYDVAKGAAKGISVPKFEQAKKVIPGPKPPKAGFTGIDKLGRRWENGKLVAAKEEEVTPPAGKKATVDEPKTWGGFLDAVAEREKAGGLLKIPELFDSLKKTSPDLTQEQFHDLLKKWQAEDKLVLQVSNDPHFEPRAGEGIKDADGYTRLYVELGPAAEKELKGREKEGLDLGNLDKEKPGKVEPAKAAGKEPEKTAGQRQGPRPPEPGFTGTDSLGRRWENGKLVPGKEEPLKGRAGPVFDPARKFDAKKFVKADPSDDAAHRADMDAVDALWANGSFNDHAYRRRQAQFDRLVAAGIMERDRYGGLSPTAKGVATMLATHLPGGGDPKTIAGAMALSQAYRLLQSKGDRQGMRDMAAQYNVPLGKYDPPGEPPSEFTFESQIRELAASSTNPPMGQRLRELAKTMAADLDALSWMGQGAGSGPSADELRKRRKEISQELGVLGTSTSTVDWAILGAKRQLAFKGTKNKGALREKLAKMERLKGELDANTRDMEKAAKSGDDNFTERSSTVATERMKKVAEVLRKRVKDPVPVAVKRGPDVGDRASKTMDQAAELLQGCIGRLNAPMSELSTYRDPGNDRAHADLQTRQINVPDERITMPIRTAIHEICHHLESDPEVRNAALEFLRHRVGDEAPRPMAEVAPDHAFKDHEMGRKDQFDRVWDTTHAYYVGKDYGQAATEILSMGLDRLFTDPDTMAAKDPEYTTFLLGILDGSIRQKRVPTE